MLANQKVTGRAVSMPAGIGLGVLVCMLLTVVLSGALAWMVLKEWVGQNAVGYAIAAILALSTLAGALLSAGKIKHRRLVVCMLVGGGYFLMLLSCTALFFGGQYQGVVTAAVVILCSCVAAGVVGVKKQNIGKKGRRKPHSR